jgi:F0F1-type ATP synthase assembly protein I
VLDFLADGCLGGLLDFLMPRTPWRLVVWLVIIGLVVGSSPRSTSGAECGAISREQMAHDAPPSEQGKP